MWDRACGSITANMANSLSSCWAAGTRPLKRATSTGRSNCGSNGGRLTKMRLRDYREDLMERLKNPSYAGEDLAQVLASKNKAAFLVVLKIVVEATGGIS